MKKLVCFFSMIFMLILPLSSFSLEVVTEMTIIDKTPKSNFSSPRPSNIPVTFALPFKRGKFMANSTHNFRIFDISTNSFLLTQVDVKRSYKDGTVRHAVISFVFPSLAVDESRDIQVIYKNIENEQFPGILNAYRNGVQFGAVLTSGLASAIHLKNIVSPPGQYSGHLTMDLLSAIQESNSNNDVEMIFWLNGPVVTEVIVKKRFTDMLSAVWEGRIYHNSDLTVGKIRISSTVENIESHYRGDVSYSVDIFVGCDHDPKYSKSTFTHHAKTRWRKVLWLGDNDPPETEVHYDIQYLIETGHVMQYDTSFTIGESRIQSRYNGYINDPNRFDIMSRGSIAHYFPTTGDRDDIGVLPLWCVYYVLTMDNRMKEICLRNGELAGSVPIHFRESDSTKTFYKKFVSVDDRPSIWITWLDWQYINEEDRLPEPLGESDTPFTVDRAHQPDAAYIPYLVTGEFYFLEEIYYWAAHNLADGNSNYRDFEKVHIQDQVRGVAWSIRLIANAAKMAPDDHELERLYFEEKVNNNIVYWNNVKQNECSLKCWGTISTRTSDGGRPCSDCTDDVTRAASPWQEDFLLTVMAKMYELGFDVMSTINWFSSFHLGRFNAPFNPYNGAPYRLPILYCTDHPTPCNNIVSVDWTNCESKMTYSSNSFPDTNGENPISYRYGAMGALGSISHLGISNVLTTFNWLKSELALPYDGLASNPKFLFVPKKVFPTPPDFAGAENAYSFPDRVGSVYGVPATYVNCRIVEIVASGSAAVVVGVSAALGLILSILLIVFMTCKFSKKEAGSDVKE